MDLMTLKLRAVSAVSVQSGTAVPLLPQLSFPNDAGLVGLSNLFDAGWVWDQIHIKLPKVEADPISISMRQLSHAPGIAAIASYTIEYAESSLNSPCHFSIDLRNNRAPIVCIYPNDRYLPGLFQAADSSAALNLVNKHVFNIPRRRIHVSVVRYRPSNRAVLKHRSGRVRFYARAVRPRSVPRLLGASRLGSHSDFVLPRIAGVWKEGGVIWISEIPGKNLRKNIRSGELPSSDELLDLLASLWNLPVLESPVRPREFDLKGAYTRARRGISFALVNNHLGRQLLSDSVNSLTPFVENWRPTSTAHNDLYDDQMVVLPDGRIALADFEDIGLGDPMLDVGNCLAHALWASKFAPETAAASQRRFYDEFRATAIDTCGWEESELSLREAVCLFRICTNPLRRPQPDWSGKVIAGLQLVNELANS